MWARCRSRRSRAEMGIRPPSLYQYFPSRLAVYDELFRRGNEELNAFVADAGAAIADPIARLRAGTAAFTRWSVEHPVIAQLMFWRPVPGFEPSPESFAPALAQVDFMREVIRAAVAAGALDARGRDRRRVRAVYGLGEWCDQSAARQRAECTVRLGPVHAPFRPRLRHVRARVHASVRSVRCESNSVVPVITVLRRLR